MHYVNEDIVLRGDEAKQFVYNLHHPNVAKIVEENRRLDKALDEVNYQETDDGFTFELEPLDWANSIIISTNPPCLSKKHKRVEI